MITTLKYLEIIAAGISDKSGIILERGQRWAYNPTTKRLIFNENDLLNTDHEIVRGLLLHETGHSIHSSAYPEICQARKYQPLFMIYNALEDVRIERQMVETYGKWASRAFDVLNRHGYNYHMSISSEEVQARHIIHNIGLACVFYLNSLPINDFLEKSSKLGQAIRGNNILYEAASAANTRTTEELIQYVDNHLLPLLLPFLEKNKQGKLNKQGGQAAPDGTQGQQAGKDKQGKSNQSADENTPADNQNQDCSQPGQKAQEYKKQQIKSMTSGGISGMLLGQHNTINEVISYKEAAALHSVTSTQLARKLKNVIQDNYQPRYYGRFKSGILTNSRVVDVCLNNSRPFAKRDGGRMPAYALYIALDASGSMRDGKDMAAYQASVLIAETAKRLQFPINIYRFGDYTRLLADNTNISALEAYSAFDDTTDDLTAIRTINKAIKPGESAIVFIIGDGAGARSELLQPAIKKLTNNAAAVIGIGIQSSHVKYSYPNSIVIENPQELPGALVKKLQQVIKRREIA